MRSDGSIRKFMKFFFVSPHWQWVVVSIILLFMVTLFWAPFGLKTTDTQEGWSNLNRADERGWYYLANGRPMVMLPWEVAAFLTSNSFIGAQLVLIAIFWGKAFFLYLILRQLRVVDHGTAFLIAVLFTIYPADTGLFTLRALGRHSAVFFYILGVFFMVLACKYEKNIYFVFMIIAHAIASFTAEAGALLSLATPSLVLLFPQCSKRRKILIAATWYLILLASLAFVVIAGADYQTMRFEQGLSGNSFLVDVIKGNLHAYWRGFIFGWWQAVFSLKSAMPYLPYAFAITLAGIGGIGAIKGLYEDDGQIPPYNSRHHGFLFLAGLVILGLGFFPYSVTDLRYEVWRVYYYAAIGPALFWGVLVFMVARRFGRWKDVIFILVAASFIFIASAAGLAQHANFVSESRKQQQILGSLAEQVPGMQSGTTFVFLVDSPSDRPFPNDRVAGRALNWMYDLNDGAIRGVTCYKNRNNCTFTSRGIRYTNASIPQFDGEYKYDRILVFAYRNQRDISLLQEIPANLLGGIDLDVNYDPYNHIIYIPFSKRPQNAFISELGPNPIRVVPQGWSGFTLTMNNRQVCDIAKHGRCALHLRGDNAVFNQQIAFNGTEGQEIRFSLWKKTDSISDRESWPQAKVVILHADGTESEHSLLFDVPSYEWSLSLMSIQAGKPYTHILISLESGKGAGSIWFDDLELFIDSQPMPVRNHSFEE